MADSDDESSVAAEDWHHEFDDYNGEHSRAAEDIYKLIYKSWPKRQDWRGHSWHRYKRGAMEASVQCILKELPDQTTSQLDFLDGFADKLNAHRAYLRQQLSPRPRRRGRSAWGRVGPVTDPLRRILGEYCFADARAAALASCRAWREAAPSSEASLLMALDPQSREPGGIVVRALDELEELSEQARSRVVSAAPYIASEYAKTTGDIRIAAAAFRVLRLCPFAPGVADAAVRLFSKFWGWTVNYELHDYSDISSYEFDPEDNVERCVAYSAGMILRENPTLVMQHFSELAASLNTYENRNRSVGASVESIFLHTLPKARVDDATAAMWMPRASDRDLHMMARVFAWRVLRWMPLAEQLLALPAIVVEVGTDQYNPVEAVEIFLAVGGAVEPYTSQIVPPMHAALYLDLADRDRYVKLLGRLGAWQDGTLDLCSLIDRADENVETEKQTRAVAARILEDVAREASESDAMDLFNDLLGNGRCHRIVSNCDKLIELACPRLDPELVSTSVAVAVDNALMRDRVNWTSLRKHRNLDVVVALVHAEESGLPSAIKQAFADGLDSLVESFVAVSLRWGLVTEPMLLVYNAILSHLSPDHVRRATELMLDLDRISPYTTEDPFEASDVLKADILATWVQGRRFEMACLPNSTARGKVSAVVIYACMEDLRARGPTPLLGNVLYAYASSVRTAAYPGFADSLLPFVKEPLPARRVAPPLSSLRAVDVSVPNAAAKIIQQRARDAPLAQSSNEARRKFRVDMIRAYGRCCAASGAAELASLLDDDDGPGSRHQKSKRPYGGLHRDGFGNIHLVPPWCCEGIPDGTTVPISSVAVVALLECVILRPGAGANLDAPTRARFLRALRGRRLVPFAALSAEKDWRATSEDDVCFDVALLFAQDPNASVRDEGYAIFKRSQWLFLSWRTLEAVGLLATSLREEVREVACRMIKQCFKNPSKYFGSCEAARDLAYKRIEPLLGDATYPADTMYEYFGDPAPDAWGWVGHTGQDMEATDVRIAAVEAASFASGWQPTCVASRDRRDRCLRALVDVMLYDPVEAVRDAAADGLRHEHGGLWLRYINPRQPMIDAFIVKKRKRRRRSKQAVERPPCVSP